MIILQNQQHQNAKTSAYVDRAVCHQQPFFSAAVCWARTKPCFTESPGSAPPRRPQPRSRPGLESSQGLTGSTESTDSQWIDWKRIKLQSGIWTNDLSSSVCWPEVSLRKDICLHRASLMWQLVSLSSREQKNKESGQFCNLRSGHLWQILSLRSTSLGLGWSCTSCLELSCSQMPVLKLSAQRGGTFPSGA